MEKTQNSSKNQILTSLKYSGGLTVDELATMLEITPMGVRQHLTLMEKDELVRKEKNKKPIGRPNYIYSLTDKAEDFFPKSYDNFVTGILEDIVDADGEGKIKTLFENRINRMYNSLKYRFGQKQLIDRVKMLSTHLNDNGHFAVVDKSGDQITLTKYNCPILQVSREFPYLCQCEQILYRDLLIARVDIDQSQASGDRSCRFVISDLDKSQHRS